MLAAAAEYFQHDASDVELAERGTLVPSDHVDDLATQGGLVEVIASLAERNRDAGRVVAPPLADRQHHLEQLFLRDGREAAHHAEVHQRQAVVGRQQHVAGMRVGVEDAVYKNLLEVGAEQLFGQGGPVNFGALDGAHRRDLRTFDVVHRQHTCRREVVDGERNDNELEVLQLAGERDEVPRLFAVIQLGHQRPAELLEHADRVHVPGGAAEPIEQRRDFVEGVEIFQDTVLDTGPLHLDRDPASAAEHGAVHLPERGRGDRRRIEFHEGLRHANAEFLLDNPFDIRIWKRSEVILQPRQRVEVGLRQQVRARREQLSELDERRTERLQIAGEGLGSRDGRMAVAFDRFEAGMRDEVGAAVLGNEDREILVSAESLGNGH